MNLSTFIFAGLVMSGLLLQTPAASTPPVRDAFRKAATRATLAIYEQNGDDSRADDARKLLDDVRVEADGADEEQVVKLLEAFSSSVRINIAVSMRIESQLDLNRIMERSDQQTRYEVARSDRAEMAKRENACSTAIQKMLRDHLSVAIPACEHVTLSQDEIKTEFDREASR